MSFVKVVNVIPASHSDEQNQDAEPNIAVNPTNPREMVISAFTPPDIGQPNGPYFYSNDGGENWEYRFVIPGGETRDQTPRFGTTSNELYYGDIPHSGPAGLNVLRTASAASTSAMSVIESRSSIDQPYVEALSVVGGPDDGKDRIYVGYNADSGTSGMTASVDLCLDARAATPAFTRVVVSKRPSVPRDSYEIRPAIHRDGTVYVAFKRRVSTSGSVFSCQVTVVRDDNWGAGATPFTALTDPSDGLAGRIVAPAVVDDAAFIGQERLDNDLTIAVDPTNSGTVYVGWCDGNAASYVLHVRRSIDHGATWSADLLTVSQATMVVMDISIAGQVGLLYQQVTGTAPNQRWETHFRTTTDGVSFTDLVLSRTPTDQPAKTFDPYLGDYAHVMAVGKDFYGVFCAANTPDLANFPQGVTFQRNRNETTHQLLGNDGTTVVPISIDPYFFRVLAVDVGHDFYVRDWTDSATSHDRGQEPSSHPQFYVSSDVWNQRGTTAPNPFDASDRPVNETPWDTTSGDNFAFARVSRELASGSGPAASVTARFLFSEFGTGSPYQLCLAGPGTSAEETVPFGATDTAVVSPPHRWQLAPTTSQHLCLAVEIRTAEDPGTTATLLGRTPGWPTTDLVVMNDNNKAQRNMGVYPALHSGRHAYYALIHNGAPIRRDVAIRTSAVGLPGSAGRVGLELIGTAGKVERASLDKSGQVVLRGMAPGENRWLGLTLLAPEKGATFLFEEVVGQTVVNGFGIALEPASSEDLARANLEMTRSVFGRIGAAHGVKAADEEAKLAAKALGRKAALKAWRAFVSEGQERRNGLFKELLVLHRGGDQFGLRQAARAVGDALVKGTDEAALAAHNAYLHKLDAWATMLRKAGGDAAAILETVRWQEALWRRRALSNLSQSRNLLRRSRAFEKASDSVEPSAKGYAALLTALTPAYREAGVALGVTGAVERAVAAVAASPGDADALQRAHRELLLALDEAA